VLLKRGKGGRDTDDWESVWVEAMEDLGVLSAFDRSAATYAHAAMDFESDISK
jgi:hypothetical protein